MASLALSEPSTIDRRRWAGGILSGLAVAFLLFDAGLKLAAVQPVTDAMAQLGWPADAATARALGALLLALTSLYAFPRTAPIGAVLLTGYLGGAVATHARIGSPLWSHTLFGVYVGALLWVGLALRDARVRELVR